MLAHTWRLRPSNTQNQAITVTVKGRYWKLASDGSVTWSAEQTLISAVSVSATTGTTVSSTVDNSGSTEKYLGMRLTCSATAASATNGTGALTITIEESTDGGTTWPSQDKGLPCCGITLLATDGTSAKLFNGVFE